MSAASSRESATRCPSPSTLSPIRSWCLAWVPEPIPTRNSEDYSADCSLDPQQVTQIGVAPFIEGTSQTDSRLDRGDSPRPGNLGVHPQFVRVFKVWRSSLRRQWAFDI